MLTETNATVLQKVAEVGKHRALVLATDATEVAQETTAIGHHAREPDFLQKKINVLIINTEDLHTVNTL